MQIDVVTPEGCVLKGDATQVTLPTRMGEISVLPDHIPVISSLDMGLMVVAMNGESHTLAVDGGFIEVGPTRINVVTETALRKEEIDVAAEEARLKEVSERLSHMSDLAPEEIELMNKELRRAQQFLAFAAS